MEQEEHVTNTYIFDSNHPTELARLINQERVMNKIMGGALAGIPPAPCLEHIIDLGCGAGGWVLDVAFALEEAEVEGVDSSEQMVKYAHARAITQHLPNASFGVMDITKRFDLPDAFYDLVNARFLSAVLKKDAWLGFLYECHRILRPGGSLRLTEPADFGTTNNDAVNYLMNLTRHALYQLGYGFSPEYGLNILPLLLSFYYQHGYENVRLFSHVLNYSANAESWADTYHNIEIIGEQMKPVFLKLSLASQETIDTMLQQARIGMQSSSFCGISHITTIIGQKPME